MQIITNPEIVKKQQQQNTADEHKSQKILQRQEIKNIINSEVKLLVNKKYLILENVLSQSFTDIYSASYEKKKINMFVNIIDKKSLKQMIKKSVQNILSGQNLRNIYEEMIKKIYLQYYVQNKIYSKVSAYFMLRSQQIYQNQNLIIKITEDYGQCLESIIKRRQSLPIHQAISILKQIMYSLSFLMKENIILTSIHPKDIVFKNGAFKINSFSSYKKIQQKSTAKNLNNQLNFTNFPLILAPQLTICPDQIDVKSQIWALGVFFYSMIAQKIPYQYRAQFIVQKARRHQIMNDSINGLNNQQIIDLLQKMLIVDPVQRISWKNLVNHPIFTNNHYFYQIKNYPIIDLRQTSFKRMQNQTIDNEIENHIFFKSSWLNKTKQKIIRFDNKQLFQQISTLQNININIKDIQSSQNCTYYRINQLNCQILKAEYIFYHIFIQLLDNKLIDLKKRTHIQLMYLLIFRCSKNINKIKLQEKKILKQARIQNYLEQIKLLDADVQIKFTQLKNKLKKKDQQTYYFSNDLFKYVIKNKTFNQKIKFFKGEENKNFTIQEQIKFTQQKYLNKYAIQLKEQTLLINKLKLKLLHYQKINSISIKQCQNFLNFQILVNSIIQK